MKGTERIEMAHRRFSRPLSKFDDTSKPASMNNSEPVPMDIGNVKLKKLTNAERNQCRKEGRCFGCREKGHVADKRPIGQGN